MTLPLTLKRSSLVIHNRLYHYIDLTQIVPLEQLQTLPYSIRILLEKRCAMLTANAA